MERASPNWKAVIEVSGEWNVLGNLSKAKKPKFTEVRHKIWRSGCRESRHTEQ